MGRDGGVCGWGVVGGRADTVGLVGFFRSVLDEWTGWGGGDKEGMGRSAGGGGIDSEKWVLC